MAKRSTKYPLRQLNEEGVQHMIQNLDFMTQSIMLNNLGYSLYFQKIYEEKVDREKEIKLQMDQMKKLQKDEIDALENFNSAKTVEDGFFIHSLAAAADLSTNLSFGFMNLSKLGETYQLVDSVPDSQISQYFVVEDVAMASLVNLADILLFEKNEEFSKIGLQFLNLAKCLDKKKQNLTSQSVKNFL